MGDRVRLGFDPVAEARRQWVAHGWPEVAESMAVVTSIMRVQQLLLSKADGALRPLGLTFARYELLMLLMFSRRGELPLGKIGQRLQVGAPSVTNAIVRLEADGYVDRRTNPEDGRGVLGAITPEGRRLARRATTTLNRVLFSSLELSGEELEELFELLRRLRHQAGDFE